MKKLIEFTDKFYLDRGWIFIGEVLADTVSTNSIVLFIDDKNDIQVLTSIEFIEKDRKMHNKVFKGDFCSFLFPHGDFNGVDMNKYHVENAYLCDINPNRGMDIHITATQVKQLKNISGYGMMDCKKALTETGGEIEIAQLYLKKYGTPPRNISSNSPENDISDIFFDANHFSEGDCKTIYEKSFGSYSDECSAIIDGEFHKRAFLKLDVDKRSIEVLFSIDDKIHSKHYNFEKLFIGYSCDKEKGTIRVDYVGILCFAKPLVYNIVLMLLKYCNYMIENGIVDISSERQNPIENMRPLESVNHHLARKFFNDYFSGTVIKQCFLNGGEITEYDLDNVEVESFYGDIEFSMIIGNIGDNIDASYADICKSTKGLYLKLRIVDEISYALSPNCLGGLKILVDDDNWKIYITTNEELVDGRMIEFFSIEDYENACAYLWVILKNKQEFYIEGIDDASSIQYKQDYQKNNQENNPDDELDQLIGMDALKADVRNLVSFVKMQQTRKEKGMKTVPVSLHLVFTGNSGTGKTTVARILAEKYKQMGILSKGQLVEVDRSGLVAGYVGQTAIKTQEKIDEAKGGILFIDEAYTLVKDGNDYGQEAIDTILKAMEDNREDFIVIVAGYPDLMNSFINSNPGLKSRFNKYFNFEDYSCEELEKIFNLMCQQYEYILTEDAQEIVRHYIAEMVNNKDDNFANARDIRNYFEKIISRQASRVMLIEGFDSNVMMTIMPEDLEQ